MDLYDNIARDIENGFIEPMYLKQKIQYVTDKESADVCISRQHSLGDYLVIGIIALQHSINSISGDILVYNNQNPAIGTIGVAKDWNSPICEIKSDSETYVQICAPVESIYQHLYMKEEHKVLGIGLNISIALMLQFSELHEGIPECIMNQLKFKHFDIYMVIKSSARKPYTVVLNYLY